MGKPAGLVGDTVGGLCLCATAAVCAAVLSRPLHPALRRHVRPCFSKMAHDGVSTVMRVQCLRHPVLTWLVTACSATVGWGYYLTGLPVLLWIVDAHLGVQSIWLMFIATWIGNAMKDLLSCPRPLEVMTEADRSQMKSCISTLDGTHAKEYGAPSTHAMNSIAMNAYLVLALEKRGVLPEADAPVFMAAVCLWSAWLSFGRVYSALHTPGDIYLGYSLGLILAVAWSQIDMRLYNFASMSPGAWLCALLLCAAVILLYPTPLTKSTPSWDQVVCFGGVAFGAVIGVGMSSEECLVKTSWPASASSVVIKFAVVRFLAGGALLVTALKGSRPVFRGLLPYLLDLLPARVRSLLQPPKFTSTKDHLEGQVLLSKEPADVEMLARFLSYAMGGLHAVWLSHAVFCSVGQR